MGPKVRPQIVNGLQEWIRQRLFPWLSSGQVEELGTFVYRESGTSPAALDGCNDDRVLMLGIGVELFRQFGAAPARPQRKSKQKYVPHPSRA